MKGIFNMRKRIFYFVLVVVLSVLVFLGAKILADQDNSTQTPIEVATTAVNVLDNFTYDGDTYNISGGNVYKLDPDASAWTLLGSAYTDPDFFEKNYVRKDGILHRKNLDTGELYPTRKQFGETFEGASTLNDLINPEQGWTGMTLLSPQAQSVQAYVDLKHCILARTCTFKDNSVMPTTEFSHSGKTSLKCYAVTPKANMSSGEVGSKASIGSDLLHFVAGDNFWFSGWYFAKEGMPFTIFELNSTWSEKSPGIRLMVQEDDGSLGFETRFADRKRYVQPKGSSTPFPAGEWVQIKIHLALSNRSDGVIQLWQDGQLVIDTHGANLPFKEAIYNSINVGITNMMQGAQPATFYLDDVQISNTAL
jgi:hypothetical protein